MSNRRQKIREQAAKPAAEAAPLLFVGGFQVPPFDGLSAAFGARLNQYPPMAMIPEEFQRHSGKFQDIVSTLFFEGGAIADFGLKWKAGIPRGAALTAMRSWLCSFDPPHEHKTATVAWALSEWTEPS